MNRHAPPSSPPTPLSAIDTGLALLGAEVLRELGRPCPSDAEILSCSVLGAPPPELVAIESQHLREIMVYLIDGLLSTPPPRRAAPRRRVRARRR